MEYSMNLQTTGGGGGEDVPEVHGCKRIGPTALHANCFKCHMIWIPIVLNADHFECSLFEYQLLSMPNWFECHPFWISDCFEGQLLWMPTTWNTIAFNANRFQCQLFRIPTVLKSSYFECLAHFLHELFTSSFDNYNYQHKPTPRSGHFDI